MVFDANRPSWADGLTEREVWLRAIAAVLSCPAAGCGTLEAILMADKIVEAWRIRQPEPDT